MPIMACRMPSTVTSRSSRLPHVTLESTAALPEIDPRRAVDAAATLTCVAAVAAARTLRTSTMYIADSVVAWLSSSGRCLSVLRSQGPAPSQSANVRAVSKPKAQERRTGRDDGDIQRHHIGRSKPLPMAKRLSDRFPRNGKGALEKTQAASVV